MTRPIFRQLVTWLSGGEKDYYDGMTQNLALP